MLKLVLSLLILVVLVNQICCQFDVTNSSIVFVVEYPGTNVFSSHARCKATVISDRHVLTTAQCVIPSNSSLEIGLERTIFDRRENGWSNYSTWDVAPQVFIHPGFDGVNLNNLAILRIRGTFNQTWSWPEVPARALGSLVSGSICSLTVDGPGSFRPETANVTLLDSTFCTPSFTQAFCSIQAPNARACDAWVGAPVHCNDSTIDGIYIQNGCEMDNQMRFLARYHSIGDFREWIDEVMQIGDPEPEPTPWPETTTSNPEPEPEPEPEVPHTMRFIVFVSEYEHGNLSAAIPKCPATVISDRHVLTTAKCTKLTSVFAQLSIDVQTGDVVVGGTNISSHRIPVRRAFVHPNADIAVILIEGERFNSSVLTPRSLGSLKSNSTFNLIGWGGAIVDPESVTVKVYGPDFCDTSDSQIFCSLQGSIDRACEAFAGSPIVSGSAEAIEGLLIRNGCSFDDQKRFTTNYYSIEDFKEWIEEIIYLPEPGTTLSPETTAATEPPPSFLHFVSIEEFEIGGNMSNSRWRCAATVISDRHVITTGRCATQTDIGLSLIVKILTSVTTVEGYTTRTDHDFLVDQAFIHPDFADNINFNNIAVLKIEDGETFSSARVIPKPLGWLSERRWCTVSITIFNTINVAMLVREPWFCDPSLPKAFCSVRSSSSDTLCIYVQEGMAVVCEGSEAIDGILLQRGCGFNNNDRYVQNYHSMADFSDWIKDVTNEEVKIHLSSSV